MTSIACWSVCRQLRSFPEARGNRSEQAVITPPQDTNQPQPPAQGSTESTLNQRHAPDGSIALVPKVIALVSEDRSRLLERLVISDLHNAPGVVGVDRICHRNR